MKRLGFTPQRLLYRAWQQDEALVEQWREKEYPKIAARAKRENAMVFFADEAGCVLITTQALLGHPKGRRPW